MKVGAAANLRVHFIPWKLRGQGQNNRLSAEVDRLSGHKVTPHTLCVKTFSLGTVRLFCFLSFMKTN